MKITLLHAQDSGHAVPTMVRFPFHTGEITGRRRDTGMAQESAHILNTGPVIPAKLGRRVSQIVGFEAVQPGPLGILAKVGVKGYVADIKQTVIRPQPFQRPAVGLQGVNDGVKGGLG